MSYRFSAVGARDGAMRYRLSWLVMSLVGAFACSVKASDIAVPPAPPAPSGWIITIGGDARAVPRYMGSNAFAMVPAPYFDIRRPQSPEGFHAPRDGIGIALFDNGVFAMGPVGSLIWQRKQTDSSSLNGLGNVGYTYEVGGFLDYWAVRWLRMRVEALQAFGSANGMIANFAVDAVVPLSPALTLSGGARARVVGSGVESPYFSITRAQSITSGLPVFNAGGGWQAFGAGTQLKYRFNPTWATYGLVEYDKLVGATASSPIVTGPGGSSNQWTFGAGLTYSFAMTGLPF
jgi:outer membrane protein